MTIKRIEAGSRMSQAVIHGDTVYLAGQVALSNSPGKPVGEQTRRSSASIDRLLGEAGTDKSKLLSAQIWLADIATVQRDERGVGRLAGARQRAGARHRRGQARRAGFHRRDHGDRGAP
jgi:enamine deaminase RidA (YjgF/YER057c/UK114 family)